MARAKGMLNLSGNLEVLAGAPLDARDRVPTKADSHGRSRTYYFFGHSPLHPRIMR